MALTRFPETDDVVTEEALSGLLKSLGQDRIISGFEVIGTNDGVNLTISSGTAVIAGYLIEESSSTVIALEDDDISYVFLEKTGTLTANTTGVPPSDSLPIGEFVVESGSITSRVSRGWRRRSFDFSYDIASFDPSDTTSFTIEGSVFDVTYYLEVVIAGRMGSPSEQAMKKVALSFNLASNSVQNSDQSTLYTNGTDAGDLTVSIAAVGSDNQVKVTITNGHATKTFDRGVVAVSIVATEDLNGVF